MSVHDAQQGAVVRMIARITQRVGKVWHDPGFQEVLRREARNVVGTVASEARAAWVRTGA